jgi:hypothetical protein
MKLVRSGAFCQFLQLGTIEIAMPLFSMTEAAWSPMDNIFGKLTASGLVSRAKKGFRCHHRGDWVKFCLQRK